MTSAATNNSLPASLPGLHFASCGGALALAGTGERDRKLNSKAILRGINCLMVAVTMAIT